MATKKTSCGKTTVEYDERCAYTCGCLPGGGCNWTVSCPDGRGGWIYTSGTGLVAQPTEEPHVTVAGTLESCAKGLARLWKRRVIVPTNLRNKRIRRRRFTGTPEEIARALGVRLARR
jgi:hypothetical protein